MERNKFTLLIVLLLLLQVILTNGSELRNKTEYGINSFSTNGQTVYHLRTGSVKKGQRAIITASIDGAVKCFTPNGKLVWQAGTNGGFPFDLCVADIDNDGLDEALVASSDGNLYALDNYGQLMWTFAGQAPLYQAGVAKKPSGSAIILTGGIERVLYGLSPEGKVISRYEADWVIRLIGTGPECN